VLLGSLAATLGRKTNAFTCASDEQCSGGSCEPSGYCSFEDPDCPSGRRYGAHASSDLAKECVPPNGETAADDGLDDSSTTFGTATTASTATSDEDGSTSVFTSRGSEETASESTGDDDTSSDTTRGPIGIDCRVTFEDDFEGDVIGETWTLWMAGDLAEATQADGVVTLTLPPTSNSWIAINDYFEAFQGSIIFELAAPPSEPDAYLWLEVTGTTTKYELGIEGGDTLLVRAGSSTEPEILAAFPFDAMDDRFLRFRAEEAQVEWAVSSNGDTWTVLHTVEAAEAELSVEHRAAFGLGASVDLPAGAHASLERFVRCL
jgi:hypothetical protein